MSLTYSCLGGLWLLRGVDFRDLFEYRWQLDYVSITSATEKLTVVWWRLDNVSNREVDRARWRLDNVSNREVDADRRCRNNVSSREHVFEIDTILTDAGSTVRRNIPLRCLRDYQENIVSEYHGRNSSPHTTYIENAWTSEEKVTRYKNHRLMLPSKHKGNSMFESSPWNPAQTTHRLERSFTWTCIQFQTSSRLKLLTDSWIFDRN